MAQNKLENQIKEKLNSREIQPSAQAWDRLDAMLTIAEEKKTKRSFFSYKFIGIAASVLVFVTLGVFFFNQKEIEKQSDRNVVTKEVEKDTINDTNTKNVFPNPVKEQINDVVVSSEKPKINIQQPRTNNKKSIINQKTTAINQFVENQSQVVVNQNQVQPQKDGEIAIKEKENLKTEIKSDEQLFKSLDKVALNATTKKSALKVDAKSLLNQVDGELDLTFREKVINSINKNYKNVKVAVSNRNKE
ncbi:hypothetical protein [Flavobacterium sp.]|uniref:hypothetical protein n=1 Tax=Flavobacterium sp. TaxID=239 RepID=UPI0035AE10AE